MCNAANHSYDCDCGFGGDTGGGGGRRWGSVSNFALNYSPPSFGWSRDSDGTVASYVNPNARCPVCGCSVYFYRSPYNGRVYFDDLGWPWPKHGCTDNRQEPRRATCTSIVPKSLGDTRWHREGWSALLSLRVAHEGVRAAVRGDFDETFVDLILPAGQRIDRESPVLIKRILPRLFRIACLASDPTSTRPVESLAFDRQLLGAGDDTIKRAADGDAFGLHAIGSYLLWKVEDPVGARPYLEAAAVGGSFEAILDLFVVSLFEAADPSCDAEALPETEVTS
jgi:hypothetical protein